MYCEQSVRWVLSTMLLRQHHLLSGNILLGELVSPLRSLCAEFRLGPSELAINEIVFRSLIGHLSTRFLDFTAVMMTQSDKDHFEFKIFSNTVTASIELGRSTDVSLLDIETLPWMKASDELMMHNAQIEEGIEIALQQIRNFKMLDQDHVNCLLRFAAAHSSQSLRRYHKIMEGRFACLLDGRVLVSQPLPLFSNETLTMLETSEDMNHIIKIDPNPMVATITTKHGDSLTAIVRIEKGSIAFEFESVFKFRNNEVFWERWTSIADGSRLHTASLFPLESDLVTNAWLPE